MHHIMPLVINDLGGRHTDTYTHIPTCEPKQFQTRYSELEQLHMQVLFNCHLATFCIVYSNSKKVAK